MANHDPNPDNYVGKKTWDEAMAGKKAVKPAAQKPGQPAEPVKNPARGNGGSASN